MLTLFAFALIWLSAALGLAAKSVETASNTPMFLTLLPFLGSGFVPTATMPAGLAPVRRVPALHPRHRNRARPAHRHADRHTTPIAAVAWSVGIALASYLWAIHLYTTRRSA